MWVDPEQITLNSEGQFLVNGEEITHERTLELFNRSLTNENGKFLLQVGKEKKEIIVEDTPFFVRALEKDSTSKRYEYFVTLNDGSKEKLELSSLTFREPGRLTCLVKGQDPLWAPAGARAKFLKNVYYELFRELQEDKQGYFLNTEESGKIYLKRKE